MGEDSELWETLVRNCLGKCYVGIDQRLFVEYRRDGGAC